MTFFESGSKWQIENNSTFHVADRIVSAQEVVETLAPHLTDERKSRINSVIEQRTYNVATVVEHLYDIGNISAVMRSAESFGFLPFHIIERPDAKYKMSDRISRGSEKWLDIYRHTSTETAFSKLRERGYKIYATDLQETQPIDEIDFSTGRSAVVFGNERDGISDKARRLVDASFKLPMRGFAQSFNISVAAALTFQTIHRQRKAHGIQNGDLSADEKLIVRAHYYLRTLDGAEKYFAQR